MSGKEQCQDKCTHDDAVPAECLEAVLRDKIDKKLDGQQCHDECHGIAYEECRQIVGDNLTIA